MFGLDNIPKSYLIIGAVLIIVLLFGIYYFFFRSNNESYTEQTNTSDDSKQSNRLILFFSPKCGHCKTFMEGEGSVWNQIVEKYKDNINISEINCDENPELATNYSITKFPTIKMFNEKGDETNYEGDRSVNDLSSFIDSH